MWKSTSILTMALLSSIDGSSFSGTSSGRCMHGPRTSMGPRIDIVHTWRPKVGCGKGFKGQVYTVYLHRVSDFGQNEHGVWTACGCICRLDL